MISQIASAGRTIDLWIRIRPSAKIERMPWSAQLCVHKRSETFWTCLSLVYLCHWKKVKQSHLLVNLLVLNGLLLELRLHVLQQVDHFRDRAVLVLARGGGRCLSSNEQAHQQQHRVNAHARANQTLEPDVPALTR